MIDSHAHLTSDELYPELDAILARAKATGISHIVNICTDSTTLKRGLEVSQRYPWVVNTASTTPHDVDVEGETSFPMMATHARQGDLVAVGETGLDYHYAHSKPETQKEFFRRYLHLAIECELPVVIHCRDAFADFFRIIDTEYKGHPGVLHCFTGSLKEAEEIVARGWYLSLSGIVTFKKSDELREVAKMVPLDQLLIETDSPYLAPQSVRGKQNEPAYLPEIAATIASVKEIETEKVITATAENAKTLFRIGSQED